jgi:hypothetical protein
MCPTGSTLQITRRDCRPRWTISPRPLNAERRLPRSTVLVATAAIRVVATEGQIYGRQLQQAGDYTGPHRDQPWAPFASAVYTGNAGELVTISRAAALDVVCLSTPWGWTRRV